jgi:putative DNA primase/helicase
MDDESKTATGSINPVDFPPQLLRECFDAAELGDGLVYAVLHEGMFVYNKSAQEWLKWNGHSWGLDIMDDALANVEAVANVYAKELQKIMEEDTSDKPGQERQKKKVNLYNRRITKLRTERGRQNCLKFAATNPSKTTATTGDGFDQNPWLLACANGVVDLRTGELYPGQPSDYISKASPVEYPGIEAPCPTWDKTLLEIFGEDHDIISYMARLFGYAITGLSRENVLPVLWGQGRNGKTTIVELISRILGPLAAPIQAEMLLDQGRSRSSAGPSPDIMSLRGLRLAFASEADEGRKFSPSRIKWLSGSDSLIGRSPHDRRETTFSPSHTLILLTNHKPHAPSSDFAFWERVHLIPFNYSFVDRDPQADNEFRADKDLSVKLEEELPGILAWLVRGCLKWGQIGLAPPVIIKEATEEYRRDEDLLADFIEDRCVIATDSKEYFKNLYSAFETWFEENIGKRVPSGKKFGKMLRDAKFEPGQSGGRYYQGLRLITL